MKKNISIIMWVIIGIVVVSIAGYFGFQLYQNFQQQKIESEKRIKEQQDLISEQQKALEQTKQEISNMTDAQKAAQVAIEEAQKKATVAQNSAAASQKTAAEAQQTAAASQQAAAASQKAAADAQAKLQELNNKPSLPAIITQWRPYIVHIECIFINTSGVQYLTQSGSGMVLVESSDNSVSIFTNKHIILDRDIYTPDYCMIKIPDDSNVFYAYFSDGVFTISNSGLDSGAIKIKNPDNYVRSLSSTKIPSCTTRASVGDSIVILGYPSIGSATDITATEGIIAGYDGDYYITSAKVEHGNSGGAAVLIKNNCYLGIPSFVDVGSVESLARILSVDAIIR